MHKNVTQEADYTREPLVCPNPECGSDDISSGEYDTDAGYTSRITACDTCGTTWKEVYSFSHWETVGEK